MCLQGFDAVVCKESKGLLDFKIKTEFWQIRS